MFNLKFFKSKKITLVYLDRAWNQIFITKTYYVPRQNEYIFIDGFYHEVISVITEPKENRALIIIDKIDSLKISEKK